MSQVFVCASASLFYLEFSEEKPTKNYAAVPGVVLMLVSMISYCIAIKCESGRGGLGVVVARSDERVT